MKKVLLTVFLVALFLSFGAVQANGQVKRLMEVESIPEPIWIFNAGTNKGRYHDRQDFGFILKENTILKVRQTNPNFKKNVTVRLLGNDKEIEKSVNVGAEWVNISSTQPLVPFVDTPYGDTPAKLEYELVDAGEQVPLATYTYKASEKEFFETWDKYDGAYALIKGEDFQLLLPKNDKELARKLKDFHSLDELIENYNDLFAFYNDIAGFDNSTKENHNGENRYFFKADIHGAGSAYYGGYWTAQSKKDSAEMWLTKNRWGVLHEIAHGYEASFSGVGMNTSEVLNNLFGVQYQYEKYGKEADKTGHLFNSGKKEIVETNLYNKMVLNNGTYESGDLREKLILLTMLKQKAGNDSFTKMYQDYRKLANQPGFNKNNYPFPDLMNRIYSENSKQDFTAALEKWGVVLNKGQGVKNRTLGYPAVASLADIIPKNELSRAHELLDDDILINSNFEMVQNKEIASLNLKGDLTLQLNAPDNKALLGATAILKDGDKEVASQLIEGEKLLFKNIPNGVYSLVFTGQPMIEYFPDTAYVYVKEAQNSSTVMFEKINKSSLANQKIEFLGLGNALFGSLATDLNRQEAVISITKASPHSYFAGKTYTKITVKNKKGDITYEKNIEGTNATVGVDKTSLQEGDIIEIYHAETKSRLVSAEKIIDSTQNTNRWLVTKYGLVNQVLQNDSQQDLIAKIEQEGSVLLQQEESQAIPYYESVSKKQLWTAIELLDQPDRTVYKKKYALLYLPLNLEPEDLFAYTFKGLGDSLFATMKVSLNDAQATINTEQSQPHWYFDMDTYASILIQDKEGLKKYNKEFKGRELYPKDQDTVPLTIGDYITVMHKEYNSSRLVIQNVETQEELTKQETTTYQIEEGKLKLVETETIPVPKPEQGKLFYYTFKGLGDSLFATMKVSLNDSQATINTEQSQPHWYFDMDTYASILIQNKEGLKKYNKEFKGRELYPKDQDTVPLTIGDYITVMHKEYNSSRLMIQNVETQEELTKQETTTYQIEEGKLKLIHSSKVSEEIN